MRRECTPDRQGGIVAIGYAERLGDTVPRAGARASGRRRTPQIAKRRPGRDLRCRRYRGILRRDARFERRSSSRGSAVTRLFYWLRAWLLMRTARRIGGRNAVRAVRIARALRRRW